MKVRLLYVHVLPVDAVAANAVQVLKMCQAFADQGVSVTLAVPAGSKASTEEQHKRAIESKLGRYPSFAIITFKQYTVFGRLKLLGGYFAVKKVLARLRPDVVFLRNIVLVRAAVKTGVPFIYESHNSLMHNRSKILDSYWTKYILKTAPDPLMKKFIAISGALGKYWRDKGIPQEKLLELHDGFDAACFEHETSKSDARDQTGLPQDIKIALYMGSLYADREIENILRLAERMPDLHFVVVGGSTSEKEALIAIADRRGQKNIVFLGSVNHSDVPTYLFSADILLMTWSRKVKTIEFCSPLKLFEYMAAGRIIVGHGFSTIREVLTDGENAYLADPDMPEELYLKMRQAADELTDEFGRKARRLAFQKYSWESRTRELIKHTFDHSVTER